VALTGTCRANPGEPLVFTVGMVTSLARDSAFKSSGVNILTTPEQRAEKVDFCLFAGMTGNRLSRVFCRPLRDCGMQKTLSLPFQRSNLIEEELPLVLHIRQFGFRDSKQSLNFIKALLIHADSSSSIPATRDRWLVAF